MPSLSLVLSVRKDCTRKQTLYTSFSHRTNPLLYEKFDYTEQALISLEESKPVLHGTSVTEN